MTLELPDIYIRPGEYSFYLGLGDGNCQKFFDIIDENVNLPWLSIVSTEIDLHSSEGYFSMPSRLTACRS